jgi:hypothetical protein
MPSTDFLVGLAFCFPLIWALFCLNNKRSEEIHPLIWAAAQIIVVLLLAGFGWGSYMILTEVLNGQTK